MRISIVAGMILLAVGLAGQTVPPTSMVSVGEQPPLITKSGGIVNLVAREAFRRGGQPIEFDWLPIGRMLKSLEDDVLTMYLTPSNTPGQQHPHLDLLAARGVFFFLKAHAGPVQVKRLEDLAGKRVATVTNSPLKPLFEKAGIIVDEGPFETMFVKLETGRVDFTSTADVGGLLTIRQLFPGREQEFDFTDFSYAEIRTAVFVKANQGSEVLAAGRKGFESMKQDGTLARMLQDFFGPTYAKRVKVY